MASRIAYIITPAVDANGIRQAGIIGPFRTTDEACEGAAELERAYPGNLISLCWGVTALDLNSPELTDQFINARGVLANYLASSFGGAV